MNAMEQLLGLLKAGHRCIRFVTFEEAEALQVVRLAALEEQRPVWMWTAIDGVFEGMLENAKPVPQTENAAAGLFHMKSIGGSPLLVTLDVVPHLAKDDRELRAWRELLARCAQTGGCVVMIDCCDNAPPVIDAQSVRLEIPLPTEAELETVLRNTVRLLNREKPVQAHVNKKELATIVKNLRGLTRRQAEQLIIETIVPDRTLDIEDLNSILAGKRRMIKSDGLLEYIESPTTLDQIGGLNRLKRWLAVRESGDDGTAAGLPTPRGVLLLGVQGAGKSLAAKAVATAWRRPLLRMDVGALYDRYVGESERRLREALRQADVMSPIVLWIDEIEKAFASSTSQSTDGGLSRRMFGTLLTWMQEHTQPVFLVATANDIEALPPELLRKGRFDEIFFVDLPGDAARTDILKIHFRKRGRDPAGFDLPLLCAACDGYSGAEIEQGIIAALYEAHAAKKEVDTAMVGASLRGSPPLSVTMAERVEALREWAHGRCAPAD